MALVLLGGCAPGEGSSATGSTPSPPAGSTATSGAPGGHGLLDGTATSLDRWRQAGPGNFERDGEAVRSRGGMGLLWFPERFTDMVLSLQWRTSSPHDNSGVFVGLGDPGEDMLAAMRAGHEVQIYDADTGEPQKTGSIYDEQPPTASASRPPGDWNDLVIHVQDARIEVELNGQPINTWTDPDGEVSGFVGLQNHSDTDDVWFRDVRVDRLEPT